ncbi:hypothetical protein [Clostridium celatum]|uniref:Membrane-spanning protein n=1 Tax=Clostridium celatum DSM 1785 TaxID=545697 RepID=L1QDU1_9CLOT|nr:hypothetical protein [Clostridium celatum]EKY25825.1 hypothetical protein HMPREF0216_02407 [Clostridium celatum DSM 1785]MCE9653651.1 hypothetical protein [Clostridium celatum]MDU2265416.1 hypothetical protein [Clostridium celatum]MDU3724357.1 hypothetical protein [Clostridium celatum]MDU6295048.1 hypothetical protein [Clostridium celatum]
MKKRKINWQKILNYFVMLSLISTIVYLIYAIAKAPTIMNPNEPFVRIKSDYVLMLTQCILGVVAMLLPGMLKHRLRIDIPSNMLILYTIFLYCAIYLGEVKSFYYNVPHWDTILHTFSGAMLGALGFSFVTLLNKTEEVPMNLSPLFVVIFSFCFAVTLGVVWEIYEFTFDGVLGLNMQKFALESGEALIGRAALVDTMKDLIVDALGAFIMSIIGYISLKYKKGWIEKLQVKIDK